MTNPMVSIGGQIREMNADELAQYKKDQDAQEKENKASAQAITDKAALLAKLGITADEAKLLLS